MSDFFKPIFKAVYFAGLRLKMKWDVRHSGILEHFCFFLLEGKNHRILFATLWCEKGLLTDNGNI